ncbi:MAG: carbohydrate porin, partial [Pseudomonadota bacterium]
LFLSFDQQVAEGWGVWMRLGAQTTDAAVNYADIYTGGVDIKGGLWGRAQDNIGLGYGYLNGGNKGIKNAQVGEAYVRVALSELFALTLDVQYQDNRFDAGAGTGVDTTGLTYGARGVVEF